MVNTDLTDNELSKGVLWNTLIVLWLSSGSVWEYLGSFECESEHWTKLRWIKEGIINKYESLSLDLQPPSVSHEKLTISSRLLLTRISEASDLYFCQVVWLPTVPIEFMCNWRNTSFNFIAFFPCGHPWLINNTPRKFAMKYQLFQQI